MKKVLRLFICVMSFFAVLSVSSLALADKPCAPSCKNTRTTYSEDRTELICQCLDGMEPSEPSGETPKDCPNWCCGIRLNTNFPIIWNCIETKDATNAFPSMMWALTKIVMSLIFVVCFILIIVAGIMRAWAWEDSGKVKKAKWLLMRVAITILLLWFSGAILKLINPNFFG